MRLSFFLPQCFFCGKRIKTRKTAVLQYKHKDGIDEIKMCNKCANKLEEGRLN